MRRFRGRKAAGHSDEGRALIPQLMLRCLIEPSLFHYDLPGYVLVIIRFATFVSPAFVPGRTII
jgi:hypothetical protein